ncbi:uncharacterized protein J3D65DRAFT_76387 [Phyllosticta citribraziliensis]|uniref:Uncharacterized protein n=1 Tax=Phyllosticta citribraziliensis TaxID=989973 RepID=A0ABR1LDD5_9PEZI
MVGIRRDGNYWTATATQEQSFSAATESRELTFTTAVRRRWHRFFRPPPLCGATAMCEPGAGAGALSPPDTLHLSTYLVKRGLAGWLAAAQTRQARQAQPHVSRRNTMAPPSPGGRPPLRPGSLAGGLAGWLADSPGCGWRCCRRPSPTTTHPRSRRSSVSAPVTSLCLPGCSLGRLQLFCIPLVARAYSYYLVPRTVPTCLPMPDTRASVPSCYIWSTRLRTRTVPTAALPSNGLNRFAAICDA